MQPAYSQHSLQLLPVADDPDVNEVSPFLTKYWYDGYHNIYSRSASMNGDTGPVWLIYKEVDRDLNERLVARNLHFSYNHIFSISDSSTVAACGPASNLRYARIENFKGRPVAVWANEQLSVTTIEYSVYADSAWSPAGEIMNSDRTLSSLLFITADAHNLHLQTNEMNLLMWSAGSTIYSTALDSNFLWGPVVLH